MMVLPYVRRRPGLFISSVCLLFLWSVASVRADLPTIPAFPGADQQVLDPAAIPKYVQALVIPPVMPKSTDPKADYNIAVRQFQQQILPGGVWGAYGYPATTVWSYGKAEDPYDLSYTAPMPLSAAAATTFNYPALTVEATQNQLTRVRWINELYDPSNHHYLPHLLPVDRTLHWTNAEKLLCRDGSVHTDCRPAASNGGILLEPYTGPVPIVTHVHGAHVNPESDGYPESWWLPAASDIPAGYAARGGLYDQFDRTNTWPGSALYGYYNTQRAATIWYHDHGLGITRLNVYAGPAGFWLIRGPEGSEPDLLSGVLPGPAPAPGEDPNFDAAVRSKIREVPIVIQGRTFYEDGSLYFPDNRAYFEMLNEVVGSTPTLDIPFFPQEAGSTSEAPGPSDVAPIWNPEFFGNTMVINGTTWPVYNVAPARYRLRLLNGCNARTLILKMVGGDQVMTRPATPEYLFYQIGSDGGLLPQVEPLEQLLMMPAERSDVIVDFSGLENGTEIYIINEGPDEPFGGGVPGTDFPFSDPATTGQIMKFVVDNSLLNAEGSTDGTASMPAQLQLAPRQDLVPNAPERRVSLNEEESTKVCVQETMDGGIEAIPDLAPADPDTPGDVERFVADCQDAGGFPFGPTEALVGTVAGDAGIGFSGVPLHWTDMTGASTWVKVFTQSDGSPVMAPVTEMPDLNAVEVWEIFNFTADAHPIHLHLVQFQVVNRQDLTVDEEGVATQPAMYVGGAQAPEAWESGWKDTVVAYPGQVTRIQARFDIAGLYVWHCHIIDHEDNEMMRPYAVIPDIDGNGCVDRADYMAILQDIRSGAGQYDLNGDGVVNIADARRVILFFTNPRGAACQPPD